VGMSFSERKGFKAVPTVIQADAISDELLAAIWNTFDKHLWSRSNFITPIRYGAIPSIYPFSKALWADYFKRPVDTIPEYPPKILAIVREYVFQSVWYDVYDFTEFVAAYIAHLYGESIYHDLNAVFERELGGYRFIERKLIDITSPQEIEALEEALQDTQFSGVNKHIETALTLYSNKENPDYRNSMKESISAVESMAKIIAGKPKASLGEALKEIGKQGKLHESLTLGFIKLYGYTSEEGGIRHGMLDDPNVSPADAKYFLLSCTSFVNYLKSKM